MDLFLVTISTLSGFFTLSQAQNLLYTNRFGYSYNQPSTTPFSILNSIGYHTQPLNKNVILPSNREPIQNYVAENYGSSVPVKSSYPSYNSYGNTIYSSSSLNMNNFKRFSPPNKDIKKSISKADAENAKFLGAENQENDNDGRTLRLKHKKFHRRFNGALVNPCLPYGRLASKGITPPPKAQGRFLWDINVHNYYPQSSPNLGCAGYGGFGSGLGGGGFGPALLADPIGPAFYPPGTGIANFLRLFAPGILQNSLATRPQQLADYNQTVNENDLQIDPAVDPNYMPGSVPVPVRQPNVLFYDSAGAPPVTPGQLVGGISTTVNGIIQQLTGNVQPVYG